MKVRRDNVPLFSNDNADFNGAAATYVGDVLQTEHESPIGYVPSRITTGKLAWRPNQRITKLLDADALRSRSEQSDLDFTGVGDYERLVITSLIWGSYSTYVLVGDMGSGKTATTKFIVRFLEQKRTKSCAVCTVCDPVLVHLNFNEGFNVRNSARLVELFRRRLYDQLRAPLRAFFQRISLLPEFLRSVATERGRYASFDPLLQRSEAIASKLRNFTSLQASNFLFQFIDRDSKDYARRLDLLMLLLSWVRERQRPDPACMVVIYDNIDSIQAEAQYEILVEILALNEIARARVLVPLRRSTFHRLNSQAAYSFGLINHDGPLPSNIIKRRLEHAVASWAAGRGIATVSRGVVSALDARARFLLETASDRHGPLRKADLLAGASVRHGLYIMERAFINNCIHHSRAPHYRDDVFRAMLTSCGSEGDIALDDPCVANVFADPEDGTFSLLPLRILQILHALEEQPRFRNVRSLEVLMREINRWTPEALRRGLNYLLYVKRPLVWVDGKAHYATIKEMRDSDDVVYLTEAGLRYISKLILDLTYVQEALMSVDWADWDSMPVSVNYNDAAGRFRALRAALGVLCNEDLRQSRNLMTWLKRTGVRRPQMALALVSNRIVGSLAFAVLGILGDNPEQRAEIEDWRAFMQKGLNAEEETCGAIYPRLASLLRDYDSKLGLRRGH